MHSYRYFASKMKVLVGAKLAAQWKVVPLLEVEALEIILNATVAVLLLLYAMVEVALEALVPASFLMEKNVPFRNYVQSGGGEQNYHWGRIILVRWRISQHSGVPGCVRRNWKDKRWRWKWWMQWMWWSSWWDSRERVMIINDGKYEQWNIFNFRKGFFFCALAHHKLLEIRH